MKGTTNILSPSNGQKAPRLSVSAFSPTAALSNIITMTLTPLDGT